MHKIGIMADIHGNIQALDEALKILAKEQVSRIFVCGDIVGYGKHPNRCCYRLQNSKTTVVVGNHGWAVIGETDYTHFSVTARQGIHETLKTIDDANIEWLRTLPLYYREGEMEFVHASLHNPQEWPYLVAGSVVDDSTFQDVSHCFEKLRGKICFVGHSHVPAVFIKDDDNKVTVLRPGEHEMGLIAKKAVVDVGSIGKPRDNKLFGSMVIYDTDTSQLKFINIPI